MVVGDGSLWSDSGIWQYFLSNLILYHYHGIDVSGLKLGGGWKMCDTLGWSWKDVYGMVQCGLIISTSAGEVVRAWLLRAYYEV